LTRIATRIVFSLLALLCLPAGRAGADAWSGSTHGLPPSRAFATLVADSTNNRAILFGGFRSETTPTGMSDLWSYDYFLGEWRQLAPTGNLPPPNWLHAAAYDGFRRRMYVLGGQGSALYALDLNTLDWSLLATSGDAPPVLTGHAMVYDWRLKQLVVFGGNYGNGLWFLNLGTLAWTHIPSDSSFPPGRSFHSFTVERLKSKVLLYGGFDGGQNYFADLWELDLATRHWTPLTLPGAPIEGRAYHDAAMDPVSNRLLVTGGRGLRATWKDTWAVDLSISVPFQPTGWESVATAGQAPDPDQARRPPRSTDISLSSAAAPA
jgi:hypothetical protein